MEPDERPHDGDVPVRRRHVGTVGAWVLGSVRAAVLTVVLLSAAACSAAVPEAGSSAVQQPSVSPSAAGTAPSGIASGTAGTAVTPEDEPVAADPPRPPEVDVVLAAVEWDADAEELWAAGWVSPVVEDGGLCSLELTRQGRTHVVRSPAFADATTTVCGEMAVPAGALTAGTWTAVLRYESGAATGRSAPATVEVPA